MISLFRPPFRSAGGSAFPTLSSAAVTLLGLRVTRAQILRVSGLLALRSLAGMIDIPLDDSVQAYLWTFLFSFAQAGVALATAASLFDFGGVVSNIVSRIFPSAGDGPFLHLYAHTVLLLGPLVACAEVAIVVYEVMRAARNAETSMHRAEAAGARFPRPALLSVACASLAGSAVVAAACMRVAGRAVAVPPITAAVSLLLVAIVNEDANVVEASIIALYAAFVWGFAVVEEAALGAPLLDRLRNRASRLWASGDDIRATTLVCSLVLLLVSMSRAERFCRILTYGHDAVKAEEEGRQAAPTSSEQESADTNKESPDNVPNRQNKVPRALISTVTLAAATFRVLIWAGHIETGEYLPIACRGWQLLMTVLLYALFVRM